MQKKGWLEQRIKEAQNDVENWPDWMKRSARFEGPERELEEQADRSARPSDTSTEPVQT